MSRAKNDPKRALIYHFTHISNIASILAMGRLLPDTAVDDRLVVDVGAAEIKANRRNRAVPCAPYGVVADYVPFYFAPRSPMMFRIACEHRDGRTDRYPDGDDPLVYLVSSVGLAADLAWVASDGNCAADLTRFTNTLSDLPELVDWPLMGEYMWKNTSDDPDRKRRRMAELLVHREFPLSSLIGYAVRTATREEELRKILTSAGIIDPYISVRPDWYYGFERKEVGE
jgi:hypothetical protein